MRILIVEDEPLIAADLEMIMTEMGHEVVGAADTLAAAEEILEAAGAVDAAFVDVKLRDGFTGVAIAELLSRTGAPVVFLTGNPELIPGGAPAAAILNKPYAEDHIRNTVAALAAREARGRR